MAISSIIDTANLIKKCIKFFLCDRITDGDYLSAGLLQVMNMRCWDVFGPFIWAIFNCSFYRLCNDSPDWCLLWGWATMITSIAVIIVENRIWWSDNLGVTIITIMMHPLIKGWVIIRPMSWWSRCRPDISSIVLKKCFVKEIVDSFSILNRAFYIIC